MFYKEHNINDSPLSVKWDNEEKAVKRYKKGAALVTQHSGLIGGTIVTRVLDFGCGLGNLVDYLNVGSTEYFGVEAHEPYLKAANKFRGTKGTFVRELSDIAPSAYPGVAICLGTHTYKYELSDEDYRARINIEISELFVIAPTVIINGFHSGCDVKLKHLYYHRIEDLALMAFRYNLNFQWVEFEKYEFFAIFTRK